MDPRESPTLPPEWSARVPVRLRPLATGLAEHWLGRLVMGTATTARRAELFDRSMTVAAQLFTSVLPVLIAVASWLGHDSLAVMTRTLVPSPDAQRVVEDTLAAPQDATFGTLGVLFVLASATSMSRALTRACAAEWDLVRPVSRLGDAWRWVAAVLALVLALLAVKPLFRWSEQLPLPGFWEIVAGLAPDIALAAFIPYLLLRGAVRFPLLLPGALVFGIAMLVIRPLSAEYLPHALSVGARHYGSMGVAFTYLAWLYVVAFTFLLSGIVGKVIATDRGRLGRWIRDH